MDAKTYLNQARYIDARINSKLEVIDQLNSLANKATSVMTDMPGPATRDVHKREKIICKLVDLENEVNDDIDKLVDLKREIMMVIKSVDDKDCQVLLEKRYVCLNSWSEIADALMCDDRTVYRMHGKALQMVKVPADKII